MKVKIKKLHPSAVIPAYSKPGDAGLDLVAVRMMSNTTFMREYGTGIAVEIPKGYVGLIFPRSSIRNMDLSLVNCVGVIDSGYRGEITFTFRKENPELFHYKVGDRIGQLIILPYPEIEFELAEELEESERGDQGYGSTGR